MHIRALDLGTRPLRPCDIEVLLRRRIATESHVSAARWQKLLELIQILRANGPYPEVWGHFFVDDLHLVTRNPANRTSVRLGVDWKDYGPLRDGLPDMHFRLRVKSENANLSKDVRTQDPREVEQVLLAAFV
jgi:hypothetical protein